MKQASDSDTILALTVAEVGRQLGEYRKKHRAVSDELAAIFIARKSGAPAEQPVSDHLKTVHARAKALLNGAGAILNLPPDASREQTLLVERDALDLILRSLERTDLIARAAEGARWAEEHGAEWKELCRQTTLAKIRLETLERRASEFLEQGGPFAGRLAMTQYVGRTLDGVMASEMADAAVAEGIVTRAEIKRAQGV